MLTRDPAFPHDRQNHRQPHVGATETSVAKGRRYLASIKKKIGSP